MGQDKARRPLLARDVDTVQALTGDSTGTAINNYGITTITVTTGEGTAANLIYTLSKPGITGLHKTIVADLNSTKQVTVRTPSSANTFYGSTKNAIQWSTGSTYSPSMVQLVSASSVQWIVVNMDTPGFASTAAGHTQDITILGATA